jgi:hypothetical protein
MASRKLLLAGALAATMLGGCAVYPYDDPGYRDGRYYGEYDRAYYDGPPYYVGPSVGLGFTYIDRDFPRHRYWHRYP